MREYRIEIERVAAEALIKIPNPDRQRIADRIKMLAMDPRPMSATKLVGADGFRIRQGNYRIVYVVEDGIRVVTVTRIGHRRDVYKEL